MDTYTETNLLSQSDSASSPAPEQQPVLTQKPTGSLGWGASIAIILAVVIVCIAKAWHDGYNNGRARLAARNGAPTCVAPRDTCQIAAEIRQKILAPILDETDSDGLRKGALALAARELASALQEHQGTQDGRAALQLIACQLDVYAQQAKARGHWTRVLACAELFEILQPGSPKMATLKDEAVAAGAKTTQALSSKTP